MPAVTALGSYDCQQQNGSALIISLVLLLLLTLTAVAGVSDSIVQERMAHNVKRTNEVFQSAETGLRYVEQQVRNHVLVLPAVSCSAAACEVPALALAADRAGAPGPDWSSLPVAVAGSDSQLWYRVVRLGDSALAVNQQAGALSTLYRVSVLSQQGATRVLLEGIYAFTRI